MKKINIKLQSKQFVKLNIGRTIARFVAMPETRSIAQPNLELNTTNICRKGAAPWRSYTGHFIVHRRQKTGGELYFFCYSTEGFSSICVYVRARCMSITIV